MRSVRTSREANLRRPELNLQPSPISSSLVAVETTRPGPLLGPPFLSHPPSTEKLDRERHHTRARRCRRTFHPAGCEVLEGGSQFGSPRRGCRSHGGELSESHHPERLQTALYPYYLVEGLTWSCSIKHAPLFVMGIAKWNGAIHM